MRLLRRLTFRKRLKGWQESISRSKENWQHWASNLELRRKRAHLLAITALKYGLLSPLRGVGKSGGAPVIIHCYIAEASVFLLSIYDKSEQASITDEEIQALIAAIP